MVDAITREFLLMGKQVVFTCVPRLCFEIKKAFDKEIKISEQDAIKTYTDREYLVLDNLGVVK
jgi:DNA replication protein DnaC